MSKPGIIPYFSQIKIPQFPVFDKSSRIINNAENGGMAKKKIKSEDNSMVFEIRR